MMTCTLCGYRFLVVAHMCDADLDPHGLYCGQCFDVIGCEQDHEEDCATRVYASRKPELVQRIRRVFRDEIDEDEEKERSKRIDYDGDRF